MKTTIVLLRHGQSVGNLYHVFLGHSDLGLSELGKQQAERAGEYLDKYRFDAIYSSDLGRAMQTAAPTAKRQHLTVIPTEGLREIDAGEWEKQEYSYLQQRYREEYNLWLNDLGAAHPNGGESVQQLAERIYAVFDRILSENPGKTLLLVTHATPIRLLKCRFLGRSPLYAGTVKWCSNASVTALEAEDGHYTILEDGYDGFLSDLRTSLPGNV